MREKWVQNNVGVAAHHGEPVLAEHRAGQPHADRARAPPGRVDGLVDQQLQAELGERVVGAGPEAPVNRVKGGSTALDVPELKEEKSHGECEEVCARNGPK